MNPIILNPDPLAILKRSNEINDPTKLPRVKDNFLIIDGQRAKPAWGSDADYNNAIKNNFEYTADNINDAKLRAIKEGKPLVVVAGSNNGDTKQLVENVVPGAKNGSSAIYVYADLSKLDPNSELGKKMSAARGDTSRPYTAIFAPKADASGNPQLEDHVANTWGARSEVATIIQTQSGSAKTLMESRTGTVAETTDKPTEPQTKPDAELEKRKLEDAAEERLAPNVKTVIDSFKQLKGSNYSQREGLYDAATKAAAAIDPKDVALVKEKTARDMKEELGKGDGADKKTIDNLKARQAVLDLMTNPTSWINMNRGMSSLHTSQLDKGIAEIREGAKSNPSAMNDPRFIENLLKTPYEVSKLKEKLPEVKFDDYLKHKAAGTLDQFVAENKPKEVVPPKVEPAEVKPEKAIKQPEKLKYEGVEFQKSLEDAFNSGRRVVVKGGAPGCDGCEKMSKNAWPDARVQQQLKDNAVFTDVNFVERDDIMKQYEANSWPSILVIEPYKDKDGKIQGRLVDKYQPDTEEGLGPDALNTFLTKNLTPPKPVDVVKQVAPPVKADETKVPDVKQPEVRPPEVKPDVKPPDVKPPETQPEVKTDKAEEKLTADEKAAFLRLQATQKKLLAPLQKLPKNADAATMDAAFVEAINNAKEVRPEDVKLATEALERQKAKVLAGEHKKDEDPKALLTQLELDSQMVKKLDQTEAYLHISRGAVKLKFNPEDTTGKDEIRTGLDLRKEMAQSSSVIGKLQNTGVPADKLKSWFPEVPFPADQPAAPTEVTLDPAAVKAAADRLYNQHASNLQPVMAIPQNATKADVQSAYKTAIENARKVNPADVQLMITALDAQKAAISGRAQGQPLSDADKVEIAQLEQDKSNYSKIGIADGILQVGLGLREISMDKANPKDGVENIRQGLALRKELLADPNIAEKLRRDGFDNTQIGQWFPGLTLEPPAKPLPEPIKPDKSKR